MDGAGIGSAMAANKVPGVRAAPCGDEAAARNAREHNDANVLTLGSKFVDATRMQAIVETFLTTHCTEERHARRVGKIKAIEESYLKEPNCGERPVLVDRIVRAVLAQIRARTSRRARATPPPGGCCPDRMGRLVDQGADRFGLQAGGNLYSRESPALIDHTLLKPEATRAADRDAVRGGARARLRHASA